jgi:hypothetical protein
MKISNAPELLVAISIRLPSAQPSRNQRVLIGLAAV